MKKPEINRLIELQRALIQFNNIQRLVYHSDRQETDTEHSYSLAIVGWFLGQYFPKLDSDKIIRFALVHDLVELHTGDTFAFGDASVRGAKAEREAAAVRQLSQDWQDFPEMLEAIDGYEQRKTPEATFVYALDKLMPALLNYINQGKFWRKLHITFDDFLTEKEAKIRLSPEIYGFYQQLVAILREHPEFFAAIAQKTPSKP